MYLSPRTPGRGIEFTVPSNLDQVLTCSKCKCKISAGMPAIKQGMRIYHPEGNCGSDYVVRCVYSATKKDLRFTAYDAQDALKKARAYFGLRSAAAHPHTLIVMQGNIKVLSEVL